MTHAGKGTVPTVVLQRNLLPHQTLYHCHDRCSGLENISCGLGPPPAFPCTCKSPQSLHRSPSRGLAMLTGILGRATDATQLKELLDASAQRTRDIADRVSRASIQSKDGFSLGNNSKVDANGQEGPIDLEQEMVNLADEQIHYETTAKLLEKAYAQLRLAIKS